MINLQMSLSTKFFNTMVDYYSNFLFTVQDTMIFSRQLPQYRMPRITDFDISCRIVRYHAHIQATMVEWLGCSTRIHKTLCSNLSNIIHGMTFDKSLTAKLSENDSFHKSIRADYIFSQYVGRKIMLSISAFFMCMKPFFFTFTLSFQSFYFSMQMQWVLEI